MRHDRNGLVGRNPAYLPDHHGEPVSGQHVITPMRVIAHKMGVGQRRSGHLKTHGQWQTFVVHLQQVVGGIDKVTTGFAEVSIQAITLYVLILIA